MRLTVLTAVAVLAAGAASAETVAPGDIQFGEYGEVEVSLTGVAGDADNGRTIMINRRWRLPLRRGTARHRSQRENGF
jgi:sulfur-oxidizing protein SoxX